MSAIASLYLLTTLAASAQRPAPPRRELPDGPGKDAYQRVCGTCHGLEIVMGRGMSREGWSQTVTKMVSLGAKINESDFATVVNYLAASFPPGAGGGRRSAGPDDVQIVDPVAADRGKQLYIAECITCHGNKARGPNANAAPNQQGSDLVRSLVVLHDRYGSTLTAFFRAGHPTQSGKPSASFTTAEVSDLGHFLHLKVAETLRSGPYNQPINVLTGDAKAGQAFFNGAGKCSGCHSPTGDLAGIAAKYDPPTLQSKFLFPRTMSFGRRGGAIKPPKPTMVTVTPPSGPSVTGTLERMDDFNVALRDADGEYHSYKRTAALKIEKKDPYQAHVDLLDKYTDKNMHDIVAYLETLK